MEYKITYYNDSVQQEILNLPSAFQAKYLALTDRMEKYGSDLGMPHTKALSGGLFELRLKSADGIARVMYCTVIHREITMLHSFIKKTQKTPKKDLAIARKRLKEVQNAYARRIKEKNACR
ncbi:MAG: type II toxin-antitoxin system RelE/ParE family toxin [Neisseriaceae bacterium]|nr:type II toxin-antitoxin system RelE/ParE family toxin [Neisseriaceae bacterium]MBR7002177.1 type II toxin-antitoxin system RelE/ParE family toxin [Neisseriaceae bacterium]